MSKPVTAQPVSGQKGGPPPQYAPPQGGPQYGPGMQQQQMGMQYPMNPGYNPMMPMMNPGMPMMGMGPGLPPPPPMGLAILSTISQVFIKQRIDLLEMVTVFDTNNRYDVITPEGGYLFHVAECSDAWSRQLYANSRAFEIGVMDLYGREVIHLTRTADCCNCFQPPALQVASPPGRLIGSVDPDGGCSTSFMASASGTTLVIEGPGACCLGSCGGAVDFNLLTGDRTTEIGRISKLWGGYLQESYTSADNFGISFPIDLSLEMKAVLIGAAILIDFHFYEHNPRHDHHHGRRGHHMGVGVGIGGSF